MVYHCSFALCKNDSRHKDQPHMQGVTWHFFPNPSRKPEQCQRWVAACQRPNFTFNKVSRTMVVCSKHFVGEKGPTEENPDPVPDNIIRNEVYQRNSRKSGLSKKDHGVSRKEKAANPPSVLSIGSEKASQRQDSSSLLLPLPTRALDPRLQESIVSPPSATLEPEANSGAVKLLRSLLTDAKGAGGDKQQSQQLQPTNGGNATNNDGDDGRGGSSSVDLGLVTLAMLAVRTSEMEARAKEKSAEGSTDDSHKCGCDCVFGSRYRLWLHQKADGLCDKCNKPCMPEMAGRLSAVSAALKSSGRQQDSSRYYSTELGADVAESLDKKGPHPPLTYRHLKSSEKRTQISAALKGKVSTFLWKKALFSRLDSLLTPDAEAEDESEERYAEDIEPGEDGPCHRCNLCGDEFPKKKELKQHKQKVHWMGTPYMCDCGSAFSTHFGLDIHRRLAAGEKLHTCRQCELAFSSEGHLEKHQQQLHGGEKENDEDKAEWAKCSVVKVKLGAAESETSSNTDLGRLKEVGPGLKWRGRLVSKPIKKYTCVFCQKVFRRFRDMVWHKKVHKGEKRFHCHICGKACLQSSELKVHLRVHTGERPYACSHCPKKFATSSGLQSHIRIHTGEKPHACSYCDRRFSSKRYMKAHIRTHTGERRHQCAVCGKLFTQSCALTVHERLHKGIRPFFCDLCGQTFVTSSYLQKHRASVHDKQQAAAAKVKAQAESQPQDNGTELPQTADSQMTVSNNLMPVSSEVGMRSEMCLQQDQERVNMSMGHASVTNTSVSQVIGTELPHSTEMYEPKILESFTLSLNQPVIPNQQSFRPDMYIPNRDQPLQFPPMHPSSDALLQQEMPRPEVAQLTQTYRLPMSHPSDMSQNLRPEMSVPHSTDWPAVSLPQHFQHHHHHHHQQQQHHHHHPHHQQTQWVQAPTSQHPPHSQVLQHIPQQLSTHLQQPLLPPQQQHQQQQQLNTQVVNQPPNIYPVSNVYQSW